MDSRAKQRLTGAVILVALFVLLVPELLTGPGDDTPADTPAEEGMRRYTIDLDAPAGIGAAHGPRHRHRGRVAARRGEPDAAARVRAQPGESARARSRAPAPGRIARGIRGHSRRRRTSSAAGTRADCARAAAEIARPPQLRPRCRHRAASSCSSAVSAAGTMPTGWSAT